MLLFCIIIIIILYLKQITSYSFEVVNEQRQQVLVFQGNATNEEEVNEDLNQFCLQEGTIETCKETSLTSQIITHANRHVESNIIIGNSSIIINIVIIVIIVIIINRQSWATSPL